MTTSEVPMQAQVILPSAETDIASVQAKVAKRLIWFLILLYCLAMMDRGASGFAALTMNRDLGLTAQAFGIGVGLFFFGYVLTEVPANAMLQRTGARFWLSRIIFSWGLVTVLTATIVGPKTFYLARLALGVAEAGFFPGIVYYLTLWFPAERRARYYALFMLSIPLSVALAAPIASSLLLLDGFMSLKGWQWLYIVLGGSSMIAGVASWFYLTDGPHTARWLSEGERSMLVAAVMQQKTVEPHAPRIGIAAALTNPTILLLGLVYAATNVSLIMAANWLPQIVTSLLGPGTGARLMISIPFVAGAIGMIVWARRSDRAGERKFHVLTALLVCGCGWTAAGLVSVAGLKFGFVVIAIAGLYASMGVFWALPDDCIEGGIPATAIALISAIGHGASAISPVIVGHMRDQTGSFDQPMVFVGVVALASVAVLLFLPKNSNKSFG